MALYLSCPAESHICALIYPPSFICIIFVANSIAIVGAGATGKIPLTYFDKIAVFPTPESPIIITIKIKYYL